MPERSMEKRHFPGSRWRAIETARIGCGNEAARRGDCIRENALKAPFGLLANALPAGFLCGQLALTGHSYKLSATPSCSKLHS
jgi:hypothetical protein